MAVDPIAQEAVDAMRAERARHDYYCPGGYKTLATCKCGWVGQPGIPNQITQWERHVEEAVLDALLSPTKKPCAECGGSGIVCLCGAPRKRASAGVTKSCPDCTDGFVLGPAPIEGLLERPSHVNVFEARKTLMPVAEPLFRLPSKVDET